MKISFITDEATQSLSELIALAQRFHIDAVELRTVEDRHVAMMTASERRELGKRLDGAGIGVCCIGSPAFKCDFFADHEAELDKLRRALDAAASLGCGLVRIFSFWRRPDRAGIVPRIPEVLQRAGDLARPTGICLGIENGKRTMHGTGAELAELLDVLDDDVFAAVWDPGNSIFGGLDADPIGNGFPRLAGRIRHVHLKDPLVYEGGRQYVELGAGQLDIPRQLRVLREHAYDGYVSLETHWRPNRVMADIELDYPGGHTFSDSGYDATAASLARLTAMTRNASTVAAH